MIEREFIKEKTKYLKAKEYIAKFVGKAAGIGNITIDKTPLGEKVVIDAVKPGLVIGRGGQTIANLTTELREKLKLENPQIEVNEILTPAKHAAVVARRITANLERFGPAKFKAVGYRNLQEIMDAGALGAEIIITGRGVPGARAHKWRFSAGYMKKSGQVALECIDTAVESANLHSGTIGIQVRIMHPETRLPDRITIKEKTEGPEVQPEEKPVKKVEEKSKPKRKSTRKKESRQKTPEASKEEAKKDNGSATLI